MLDAGGLVARRGQIDLDAGFEGAAPPILVCLLGTFRLLRHGQPLAVRRGGKSEGLLTLLGLAPLRGVAREALLGAMWPDSELALAGHALNTLVHRMRALLADALGGAPPVVLSDGLYRLNLEAGIRVDVALFKALVADGDRHVTGGLSNDICSYEQAIHLYQGDLVDNGLEGPRTFLERDSLHAAYLSLLMRVSDHYFACGDFGTCLVYALQLLGHDPCREDAHRQVMRCYVRRGERAQALRHYRTVQSILRAEFDTEPEPATSALFEKVRLDPGSV